MIFIHWSKNDFLSNSLKSCINYLEFSFYLYLFDYYLKNIFFIIESIIILIAYFFSIVFYYVIDNTYEINEIMNFITIKLDRIINIFWKSDKYFYRYCIYIYLYYLYCNYIDT